MITLPDYQTIAAMVRARSGVTPTAEEIDNAVRAMIASYVDVDPKTVEFERGPSGEILSARAVKRVTMQKITCTFSLPLPK